MQPCGFSFLSPPFQTHICLVLCLNEIHENCTEIDFLYSREKIRISLSLSLSRIEKPSKRVSSICALFLSQLIKGRRNRGRRVFEENGEKLWE